MKKILLSFYLFAVPFISNSQNFYNTTDSIDIGNIKAMVQVHGELWPDEDHRFCEFPKGSNKRIGTAAGLWISGYDAGNTQHISAAIFRGIGVDFWPGPLDNSGNTTTATMDNWAKIWKINRADIDQYLSQTTHTVNNTPEVILHWPAKGNQYAMGANSTPLSITEDMAPFTDMNGNDVYEPLAGDFPSIKGDQMLWWVINDNGPTHTSTDGIPLKIQLHISSYAYNRGTLIDNVVYYDYEIKNKSGGDYSNVRIGQFADLDVGDCFNDYAAYDMSRRMAYLYNGSDSDYHFGTTPPVVGITMIKAPGDGVNYYPAGSFMAFNNGAQNGLNTDPHVAADFDHYMHAEWKDGSHLTYDFQGAGIPSSGIGGIGPQVDHMFTGNPTDSNEWSEYIAGNPPGDRRAIISTKDLAFNANATLHLVTALVVTDESANNSCPELDITGIQTVCDTAWAVAQTLQIAEPIGIHTLNIYPNPTTDKVYISPTIGIDKVQVMDITGKILNVPVQDKQGTAEMDLAQLPAGTYFLGYTYRTQRFVKKISKL